MFRGWKSDIRFAFRVLHQSPLVSLAVITILALGIGANTAIFSAIESLLLQGLPYPDSDRVVLVWERNPALGINRESVSGATYLDWKERSKSFEDLACMEVGSGTVTGIGEPQQVPGMRVSANFFDLLGARPAAGRLFTAKDSEGDEFKRIGLTSYGFWQRSAGGDPSVVGKTIHVDLMPATAIGVVERDFWLPVRADLFAVWPESFLRGMNRNNRMLAILGRLKKGVTREQAEAELSAISHGLEREHSSMRGWRASVTPMQETITESVRPALLVLMGSVGLVLLIACANIANLLLARAISRRREVSIRLALGAGRARILRQLLTESALLSLIGGGLGVMMAMWLVDLFSRFLPAAVALQGGSGEVILRQIEVSPMVLLGGLGLSLLTGILFGALPALEALRTDIRESLISGGRGATGRSRRVRALLLTAQVAVTAVLMIGAGALLKSFVKMQHVDPGFRTDQLLTLEIELPTDARFRDGWSQWNFFNELQEKTAAIPGVKSAAVASLMPFATSDERWTYRLTRDTETSQTTGWAAEVRQVSASYRQTMNIPLRAGRFIETRDTREAPLVAVVDEKLVQRHWKGQNPIGQRIAFSRSEAEIVGVLASTKQRSLNSDGAPTIYLSAAQIPNFRMNLVLHTAGNPASLIDAVKQTVWSIDKDVPVYRVQTMKEAMQSSLSTDRITLVLVAFFAASALCLASFGAFAIVRYTTAARAREFGIRLALGATPPGIVRTAMSQAAACAAAGLALGVIVSHAALEPLRRLLYEVSPMDPAAIAAGCGVFFLASMAASAIPAISSAKTDPSRQLHVD
jgi:predicted permease